MTPIATLLISFIFLSLTLGKTCCNGETWTNCPVSCKKSYSNEKCCAYNYICVGNNLDCLYRYSYQNDLKVLE